MKTATSRRRGGGGGGGCVFRGDAGESYWGGPECREAVHNEMGGVARNDSADEQPLEQYFQISGASSFRSRAGALVCCQLSAVSYQQAHLIADSLSSPFGDQWA